MLPASILPPLGRPTSTGAGAAAGAATLKAPRPTVELYRRELQRSYVVLLLVASGTISDPQSASTSIDTRNVDSGTLMMEARRVSSERMAASPLAEVIQQYRREGRPSEFRSSLRSGAAHLYAKIEAALKRVKDPATAAHLKDLRAELGRM